MLVETTRHQVFQISPTVRVVAEYEQDYETIGERADYMGLGIQTLRVPNHFISYSSDDEVKHEITEIVSEGILIEDSVTDYFTDNGIPFLVYGLKGFSQGEWHTIVIYDLKKEWNTMGLESVAEEFDALFAGEVYRVTVEHAKVFTAPDGDTRTEWTFDEDFNSTEVTEKLFSLNADFIKATFNLEVVVEVEG
jgi:hypothetical protein